MCNPPHPCKQRTKMPPFSAISMSFNDLGGPPPLLMIKTGAQQQSSGKHWLGGPPWNVFLALWLQLVRSGYTESKTDSLISKHQSSSPAKTLKVQSWARTLRVTVFQNTKDVLMVEFIQPYQTMNAAWYCETLNKLTEVLQQKVRKAKQTLRLPPS